jgi:hypothetical protein
VRACSLAACPNVSYPLLVSTTFLPFSSSSSSSMKSSTENCLQEYRSFHRLAHRSEDLAQSLDLLIHEVMHHEFCLQGHQTDFLPVAWYSVRSLQRSGHEICVLSALCMPEYVAVFENVHGLSTSTFWLLIQLSLCMLSANISTISSCRWLPKSFSLGCQNLGL